MTRRGRCGPPLLVLGARGVGLRPHLSLAGGFLLSLSLPLGLGGLLSGRLMLGSGGFSGGGLGALLSLDVLLG